MNYRFLKFTGFFLAFSFLIPICRAQSESIDFDNYTPLFSSGDLPSEFSLSSSEKYRMSRGSISNNDDETEQEAKDAFYLRSAFAIDELLKSGKVLFNDPVGIYVNKVFEKVLKAARVDKKKVKVFVVKTNRTNAFATDQGIIFITTGLIARLENEAQLAFILCHELIHIKKKHSIDVYVNAKKIEQNLSQLRLEPAILSQAAYSKEKETEADLKGIEIFLRTDYNPKAAQAVFTVLKFSYLPFENTAFNREFFEADVFFWPRCLSIKSVSKIEADENEDDSKSTHPNIFSRRQALKDRTTGHGKDFILPESEFNIARKICRFEYCRNALLTKNYCLAIYAAYCLLKENPNSLYLKKTIAKSLYAISTYHNQGASGSLNISAEGVQGQSQQVYFFFEHLTANELNSLAVQYLWALKKENPNDSEVSALFNDIFYSFVYLHSPEKHISKYTIDTSVYIDSTYAFSFEDEDEFEIDWDEKAREVRSINALLTLIKDKDFESEYEATLKKAKTERDEVNSFIAMLSKKRRFRKKTKSYDSYTIDYVKDYKRLAFVRTKKAQQKRKLLKKKYSGVFNNKIARAKGEKVVFLNPIYYFIDEREDSPIDFEISEEDRSVFIDRVLESAKAANVPYELLSENTLNIKSVDVLNRITLIKEWTDELLSHTDIDIIPSDQGRINTFSNQIDSRYLCLTGNIYTIQQKKFVSTALLFSLVIYAWPITLPYLLQKDTKTNYFFLVLDLKSGDLITADFNTIHSKNREDISLATFYDFMLKTKLYQLEK
jgi:hypothetical protein